MKLNEKQTHALEEIYRVARMYTKIAAELNKVADTIELESEKNDEEFMKVFGVSQGYYMNDIVRVFDNLPEHAHEQIGELIIAFKKRKGLGPTRALPFSLRQNCIFYYERNKRLSKGEEV